MHEKVSGSKLAILPDSRHMNFVDQPELWRKAFEVFWAENGGLRVATEKCFFVGKSALKWWFWGSKSPFLYSEVLLVG